MPLGFVWPKTIGGFSKMALYRTLFGNATRRVGFKYQVARFSSVVDRPYAFDNLFVRNHQDLPRLPIPKLKDTVGRYLTSVGPLCADKEEFARIQTAANDFLNGVGPALQAKLILEDGRFEALGDAGPAFYFEEAWDQGYLGARCPSPININPFYIVKENSLPQLRGQINRTAHLIKSSVRWQRALIEGDLAAEKSPLCVATLGRQMGTARIPLVQKDVLRETPRSRHVVFQWRSEFYKMDVLDSTGTKVLSLADIKEGIEMIMTNRSSTAGYDKIGVLTTLGRTEWAQVREDIAIDETNARSLQAIDEALMIIALDDDSGGLSLDEVGTAMLTGDGRNRWFDKHQYIVTKSGLLGINFEHSHSDGTTWNRMIHEVWHDMESRGASSAYGPLPEVQSYRKSAELQKLTWKLRKTQCTEILRAATLFDQTASNVDLKTMVFADFAKSQIKEMKMSPDAVCQMAFHMSYMKVHGTLAPTYESCSTRQFFRGRTETIRSLSPIMSEFVSSILNPKITDTESRGLMYSAAKMHVDLAKAAAAGMGCDRHLLGLKIQAQKDEKLQTLPTIFTDEMFAKSSTFILSTSNVSSPELDIFGFGAVTHDGYGIGYQVLQDSIPICITSYHDNPNTNSNDFKQAIAESLHQINALSRA
jgi:hypothetical protein